MNQYRTQYLSQDEVIAIQQRITDIYGDDYLQPHEYHELFLQLSDEYVHAEDDTLYINNQI